MIGLKSKRDKREGQESSREMTFEWLVGRIRHVRHIYWLSGITVFLAVMIICMPRHFWAAFWSSLRHHMGLVSMLVLFALISLSLIWKEGEKIDSVLFCTVNACDDRIRPQWLDRLMLAFTQIGNGAFTVILALVFFFRKNWMFAVELIFSTLLLWFVVELIKVLINRSRPYKTLQGARVVGHREKGRSFPSGHTSQSFYLATLLMQYFHTSVYIALLLYFIAFLVGITRIYVGAHYPRDVMAGAVLGTVWGLIGVIANRYIF